MKNSKTSLTKKGFLIWTKKRPLPKYPKKIGVITSATGAAFHDIINVISRRYPLCEIIFCPAFVQGSECAASNISALEEINKHDDIDLIILGRGGGSKEDLWGYNDENLVRAVRNSKIPVITGIGHEIDTSLCDLASDKSAPTPSAAAEIAVPDIAALYQMNDDLLVQINKEIKNYLENKEKELTSLNVIIKSFDPLTTVNSRITEIENLKVRAENAIKSYLSKEEIKVNSLDSELKRLDPVKMMKKGLLTVDISGKKN
jgi:exodeoxyribonuclease VII large subunit